MAVGGMVLDGGTDAGVMSMIGQGLTGIHRDALRVLGVSPAGLVHYPSRRLAISTIEAIRDRHGEEAATEARTAMQKALAATKASKGKTSPMGHSGSGAPGIGTSRLNTGAAAADVLDEPLTSEDEDEDELGEEEADTVGADVLDPNKAPLEPHHSHFFLAPTDEWGGETSTMFTVTCVLRRRLPTIAVLANGGFISMKEIVTCVQLNIPVIAIEGSGRLADKIAQALADRSTLEPDAWAATKAELEEDVLNIIEGDVTLFPVTGSAPALQDIILAKLHEQRVKMLADKSERRGITVAAGVTAGNAGADAVVVASGKVDGSAPPPDVLHGGAKKRPGMSIKIEGGNKE
jgi:hypothetical protein